MHRGTGDTGDDDFPGDHPDKCSSSEGNIRRGATMAMSTCLAIAGASETHFRVRCYL